MKTPSPRVPARWFAVRSCSLLLAVLCLLTLPATASAEDKLIGVYLTWKQDPTTTITINWVNKDPESTLTVWSREVGQAEWSQSEAKLSTVGPTPLQIRRTELTGLKPDTVYEFAIGEKLQNGVMIHKFRTMPEKLTRPVRFVDGGDMMHARKLLDAMNFQMREVEPDFAVLGGDLAYANGVNEDRWVDWLGSWQQLGVTKDGRLIPMVLAIGNHEVKGGYNGKIPEDAPYFYALFSTPEDRAYYTLDFGKYLSLVILDSGHTNRVDGAQAEWLDKAMSERKDQQFLFASYHYPAYGTEKAPRSGLPIDATKAVRIQQHWCPIFEKYGLTVAFEHDHHNFKRTHRIRNRQRDDEYGILYLGDGAWGVLSRTVPDLKTAWWLAKAEPRNHLWCVDIKADGTAHFRAIDVLGEVFDDFTLEQPRSKPAPAEEPGEERE